MLISSQTKGALDVLIQRGFIHNRTWDNFLGFSNVKWAFVNFGRVFHKPLAHMFPLFSDLVADMELRYNVVPNYYDTPKDLRVYKNVLEFCEINLREHIETYKLIQSTLDIATENNDSNIRSDLEKLTRMWNVFMEQAILLRDKAQVYDGNDWAFDAYSEQFYVMGAVREELLGG